MNILKKYKHLFIVAPIFLSLLAIDMIFKFYTYHNIPLGGEQKFIPYLISLTYVQNPGMAMGFKMPMWILITVSSLLSVAIVFLIIFMGKRSRLLLVGLSFVLAGAIGNLIDRIALGFVVDMFKFEFMNFFICNFADYCVNIGAVLLIIYIIFIYKTPPKKAKEIQNGNEQTTDV